MFIMFSESALKNVKTMKQRCSALIASGTSTRVTMNMATKLSKIASDSGKLSIVVTDMFPCNFTYAVFTVSRDLIVAPEKY